MPASIKRKKSKRMTCRRKYKIVRKVAEHKRKVRREQKKNPKHHKPKDPGVPNSLPFKEEILQEAEQRKQRAEQIKITQRANRLKLQLENRGLDDMLDVATKIDKEFKPVKDIRPKERILDLKSAISDLRKLVEEADIILQVLDARDPMGCRCPQLEELVLKSNKKLLLVLNKIDVIPKNNLEEWLRFFRQSLPTFAFKSSTTMPLTNPPTSKGKSKKPVVQTVNVSSQCIGGSLLLKALRNYRPEDPVKVAIVGFPKVGKHSVMDSLTKMLRADTSKRVKILESPGTILSSDTSPVVLALRNMVRVETLQDKLAPAEAIVRRAPNLQLCLHYTVPEFGSCEELLTILAKRMGKFRKGGVPNVEEGAKRLVNDWNRGVIKYFSRPPQVSEVEMTPIGSEFQVNPEEENSEFSKVKGMFASKGVEVSASSPTDCGALDANLVEEAMDEDNEECPALVEDDGMTEGKKKRKKCKKSKK